MLTTTIKGWNAYGDTNRKLPAVPQSRSFWSRTQPPPSDTHCRTSSHPNRKQESELQNTARKVVFFSENIFRTLQKTVGNNEYLCKPLVEIEIDWRLKQLKTSRFVARFWGISPMGFAYMTLRWFRLARICFQVNTLQKRDEVKLTSRFLKIGYLFHRTLRTLSPEILLE